MRLSLGNGSSKTDFRPVDVAENELADFITKNNYSTAVFKDGYRTNDNFISTECIALDFDHGLSIEAAEDQFAKYKHIIGPTRNHRVEKNGVVADRFRVLLFLKDKITDRRTYSSTIGKLLSQYPQADHACKDPARMFFPCKSANYKAEGEIVDVVPPAPEVEKPPVEVVLEKGELSRLTMDLLIFGADQNWNKRLFKAAKDMHEQGYNVDEAKKLLSRATCNYKTVADYENDKTIKSAYKEQCRHPKRGQSAFEFKDIKQLFEEKPKIEWFVERMLSEGGMSIIAGPPKSGKSTLSRQLAVATAQGGEFLGRKLKQGQAVYLALEEQVELIYSQFKALGTKEDDPIVFHAGPPFKNDPYPDFEDFIHRNGPRLAVIDTLVMFANIEDQNNYREVYQAISKYRTLARESGCHILCVHHTNKGGGMMGSTAFTGAVDAIMYFKSIAGKRFLTTEGRGTLNFHNQPLNYIEEVQRYELGGDNEF